MRSACALSLACFLPLASCTSPAPDAAPRDAAASRDAIFDGVSLAGWEGDARYWSIEDGSIVGRTTADTPLPENTFLIWTGEPAGDFELRAEVLLRGDNNSGIQYRSTRRDGFSVAGYQCDIHTRPEYDGMLYEEGGRGIVATQGTRVRIAADGRREPLAAPEPARTFAPGAWHEYVIVARGKRLEHRVDEHVTAVVEDGEVGRAASRGIVALQLHVGAPYEVRFRNIRLKRLEQ